MSQDEESKTMNVFCADRRSVGICLMCCERDFEIVVART